jgi:acetyltransferase
MAIRNLDKLFYPRSVAVIGASSREGLPGHRVMKNLLHGGFDGPIMPVSGRDAAVAGVFAYPSIAALPLTPDLAVVCRSTRAMPAIVRELGERGTRAAILLGEDDEAPQAAADSGINGEILAAAKPFGLRILGPRCLGAMVPGIGLNATLAHTGAQPGSLAFVSQSTTICSAVLDWANDHDIGFSYFISLGETADVDFGDVIDFLGSDAMTRGILLYLEEIGCGRTFMSAGRGASRNKPVIVIKGGRTPQGQRIIFGDAGAKGADEAYDAAIRRAGMLRVYSFGELFAAVETLARIRPRKAKHLAMISNGQGLAAIAVDALITKGGCLADCGPATLAALAPMVGHVQPPMSNPVILAGDAPAEQYATAARALLADPSVDTLLVLHAPTGKSDSAAAAAAIISVAAETRGQVLTSWPGGSAAAPVRRRFADAGIPTYDTPTQAIDAFLHMMHYRQNQELLMETPPSVPADFAPAVEVARATIVERLVRGGSVIDGREAATLLTSYGIPTVESRIAGNPDEAATVARTLGFPVALKLCASDADDDATVGGACQLLNSEDSVRAAASDMLETVRDRRPQASLRGLLVERMIRQSAAQEVMISVNQDPIFGPVIVFGHGGPAADVLADRAMALPPLNITLAQELVLRTRVSRLLTGYGARPPADLAALCRTLVAVSQMIIDLPEIVGLEINPLFVDERGVFAAGARLEIAPAAVGGAEDRLAIRPYPKDLEEPFALRSGRTVLLRPIRPEDEPAHYEFLSKVTPEDIRLRFFHLIRQLPHAEMARLTQIDYDREMAIIATAPKADGSGPETLGVVRIVADLNNERAEYAILVRSDQKGQGLGKKLMEKIVAYCRSRGTAEVIGMVLRDNRRMLDLVHSLGFTSRMVPDEDVVSVRLALKALPPAEPAAEDRPAA